MSPELEQAAEGLYEVCNKVGAWLMRQAEADEKAAKTCSFEALTESYLADAKNRRTVAGEIALAMTAFEEAKKNG